MASPKVFVSFASHDRSLGRRLCARLFAQPVNPWNYGDDNEGSNVVDTVQHLKDQIDASDFFLPLVTPNSFTSPFVRLEVEYALARPRGTRPRIIPLVTPECSNMDKWPDPFEQLRSILYRGLNARPAAALENTVVLLCADMDVRYLPPIPPAIEEVEADKKSATAGGDMNPGLASAGAVTGTMMYDVFISYRREDGSQTARLIQAELRQRGFRIFLDVDGLRPGHFDQSLLRQIEAALNFVLILSQQSLCRCSDDKDWLRLEVVHAIATKRNIVPIIMPGFEFPASNLLPEDMASLRLHHAVPYSHEFFGAMIDKLVAFLGENRRPGDTILMS